MTTKKVLDQFDLGQRQYLSFYDSLLANRMYECECKYVFFGLTRGPCRIIMYTTHKTFGNNFYKINICATFVERPTATPDKH